MYWGAKWRRVDTDTPLSIIVDGNRFLVLRGIGSGPATQATAQPRHRISHTGFSPQALGGMWGEGGRRQTQHLNQNLLWQLPSGARYATVWAQVLHMRRFPGGSACSISCRTWRKWRH